MKYISLSQGKFAIVDDEDYEEINKYRWHANLNIDKKSFYARRASYTPKYEAIRMHRLLLGLAKGDRRQGDHINGYTLDNRKENLRIATQAQNNCNTCKRSNNKSGFKGVSAYRLTGKWIANCRINRRQKHLGIFSTKEDAAQVYILIAYIHYGEFATIR